MARAFFRPPTLGRRPLKTGNRKWAGFPRAGKPTSQVGFSTKLQIAHSTQLEDSNPQSEGAYGKSVFSPPDPGTAPPENRKPKMGWFSKGWKTDFPSWFSRPLKNGPISARARSRYVSPEKMHFALSQFRNGFAERCEHTRLIQLSPRRAKRALGKSVFQGLENRLPKLVFPQNFKSLIRPN